MRNIRILIYVSAFLLWTESIPFIYEITLTSIYGMTFYLKDFVFGLLLFWSISNLPIFMKNLKQNNLHQRAIFLFMLWGLIPMLYGLINNNNNLIGDLRFFAWGLLGIVGPLGFKSFQQFYRLLKFYMLLHTVRILYFLGILFTSYDFTGKFLSGRFDIMACTILITGIAIFIKNKSSYEKFLCYIVLPLSFLIVLADYTRALYLEYIVSFFILIVVGRKIRGFNIRKTIRHIAYMGFAVTLLIIPMSLNILENVEERFGSIAKYQMDPSAMARIVAWKITIDRILHSPLFGYGSGANVGVFFPGIMEPMTPHNAYLQIAVWGGIITVLFFLMVQCRIIRDGLQQIRKTSPQIAVFLLIGSAMATGFIFASLFTPTGANGYFHFWYYSVLVLIPLRLSNISQPVKHERS